MARGRFWLRRFIRQIINPLRMKTDSPSLEHLLATLKSLGTGAGAAAEQQLPPVESRNPPHCGEAGLEILSDGTWLHEGVRITRESLVRLFASILRKDDDGETYAVTPVEKIRVRVADAPFVAVRADRAGAGEGQTILFTTNVGDIVRAGPERPIRVVFDPMTEEPRPYILVRGRLEARVLRAPFYELVEWGETRDGVFGVWSGGAWFPLEAAAGN